MKLTPKQYKMLVKIANATYDYSVWSQKGSATFKNLFKTKWPEVYKLGNQSRYESIFYHAIREVTSGKLDGQFAKAFT